MTAPCDTRNFRYARSADGPLPLTHISTKSLSYFRPDETEVLVVAPGKFTPTIIQCPLLSA